jgi:aminotransferase EvaB
MDPVLRLAQAHGFHILEDCAQCHGATYKGRKAGSMSSYSTFSFYPTKPLGGFGDAGMVLTDDEQLDKKMRRLRFYGMEKTYYAEEHGYNSRLDEVQAEILLRRLGRLEGYIARRQELAARYDLLLSGCQVRLPQRVDYGRHVFYLYVVAHPERERVMAALAESDILVNISYPHPIHTMRGYAHLGYREGDFAVAESAARQIFSLPMYPSLSFQEQDRVCEVLREVV